MKKWYFKPYIKNWGIGWNNYWRFTLLYVEETPIILMIIDFICSWFCHFLTYIPLPPIPFTLSDEDKIIFEKETSNWHDWYGSVGGWFCCNIHRKVTNWISRNTIKYKDIYIPYEYAKKEYNEQYIEFIDDRKDSDIYSENEHELGNNIFKVRELQYNKWLDLQYEMGDDKNIK